MYKTSKMFLEAVCDLGQPIFFALSPYYLLVEAAIFPSLEFYFSLLWAFFWMIRYTVE